MTNKVSPHATSDDQDQPSRAVRLLLWLLQPKIDIPLCVFVALIVGPFAYRGMRLSLIPEPPEPFDIAAFKADIVPDDSNAASLLIEATKLFVPVPAALNANFDDAIHQGWEAASEDVRKWCTNNRPALDAWLKAARMPDMQLFKPGEFQVDPSSNDMSSTRHITHLLILEADRLRIGKKQREAYELLLDGHRVADHIARRGSILDTLIAEVARADVGSQLVKHAASPLTTSDDLKYLLRELQDLERTRPAHSHAIKVEYLWIHGFTTQKSLYEMSEMIGSGSPEDLFLPLLYFRGEPDNTRKATGHLHGRTLEQIDKPRHQRTKLRGKAGFHVFEADPTRSGHQWSADEISEFVDATHLARTFGSSIEHIIRAYDSYAARRDMTIVAIALEIHQREYGHYPDRLDELVPNLLPTIPDDALAATKTPLKYSREGDSAKLWSVGENETDDGGAFTQAWNRSDNDLGIALGPLQKNLEQKKTSASASDEP